MRAREPSPVKMVDWHLYRDATSSRSDQTQIPVWVPLFLIHSGPFDSYPRPASRVERELARCEAAWPSPMWIVHRCGSFTDVDQNALNGSRLGEEGNDF